MRDVACGQSYRCYQLHDSIGYRGYTVYADHVDIVLQIHGKKRPGNFEINR